MNSVLIDGQQPCVAELFRLLDATVDSLNRVEKSCKPLLNGHRYITDKELSAMLKISRRTLQDYRSEGLLPYYMICGKVIYKESDIQDLLENAYKRTLDAVEFI